MKIEVIKISEIAIKSPIRRIECGNLFRECCKCRKLLPFRMYSKDRRGRLGRRCECKICNSLKNKAKWKIKAEEKAEKERLLSYRLKIEGKKICHKCLKELPYSDFSKDRHSKDGLVFRCKKCVHSCTNFEQRKIHYHKNKKPPKIRKYDLNRLPNGNRICNVCQLELTKECFGKTKDSKDGIKGTCKRCAYNSKAKARKQEYSITNKDITKKYMQERSLLPKIIYPDNKKLCPVCKISLDICKFARNKNMRDGLGYCCSACLLESSRETRRLYNINHRSEIKEKSRKRYITSPKAHKDGHKNCPRCKKRQSVDSFTKSIYKRDGLCPICKDCSAKQSKKDRDKNNKRNKIRRKNDHAYKLKLNLRRRLILAIKNKQKYGKTIDSLGCSIEFLVKHISNLFTDGMSWENWGNKKGDWNLDHIIPLSRLDIEHDLKTYIVLNNYRNLQPLWRSQNQSKSNVISSKYNNGQDRFDKIWEEIKVEWINHPPIIESFKNLYDIILTEE
jgi:hypothetical protein